MDPGGMAVDMLRSCHRVLFRYRQDNEDTALLRWFFCEPNAKLLPFATCLGSNVWEAEYNDSQRIGQFDRHYLWDRGRSLGKDGQNYVGNPDWFVKGIPDSDIGACMSCCKVLDTQTAETSNAVGSFGSMYAFTIPGGTLKNNGDRVEVLAYMSYAVAVLQSMQVQTVIGGVILGPTVALGIPQEIGFALRVAVCRISSATYKVVATADMIDLGFFHEENGVDFSNPISVDLQGQSSGAGASTADVLCHFAQSTLQYAP